jgi:hypothetical protein
MKPYALLLAIVAASLPAALSAAENRELAELRQQIEQMKRDYEQRIQGLEARLKKAEAAVKQARPAPVKTMAQESALDRAVREATASVPSEQPPTTVGSDRLGSATARLIDISFNTLVASGWSTEPNEVIEELQGGNHDPRRRGFTLHQGELGLKGPRFGCGLAQCGACTVIIDGIRDCRDRSWLGFAEYRGDRHADRLGVNTCALNRASTKLRKHVLTHEMAHHLGSGHQPRRFCRKSIMLAFVPCGRERIVLTKPGPRDVRWYRDRWVR